MAKKKNVKKKAKRLATFGLISALLIFGISLTFFKNIISIIDKYREKSKLENELLCLQDKQKELQNNVKKLEDPKYLARYAREKYFYSKNGELILRIPED